MPASFVESLKKLRQIILETNDKYNRDNCPTLAAALAFHSFFSIFPLLLFFIYIGTFVLDTAGVYDLLSSSLMQFLPTGGDTISEIIAATLDLRGSIGLVGGIGLLWSSSSVFAVLETSLNRIWDAHPRGYWRRRLVATVSILVMSVVFLSLVTLGQFLPRLLALIQRPGLQWLGSAGSFLLLVLVLTIFYSELPNRNIPRRPALLGGLVAAAAIFAARQVFDLFINSTFANYGAVYGSLAWFVSVALWTFVVATLFLLGAEFGAVLEKPVASR
jgi:YihY family inner membrane protein